ncbi:hypothetical protein ISCGN_021709 [Ixodes scapularis]
MLQAAGSNHEPLRNDVVYLPRRTYQCAKTRHAEANAGNRDQRLLDNDPAVLGFPLGAHASPVPIKRGTEPLSPIVYLWPQLNTRAPGILEDRTLRSRETDFSTEIGIEDGSPRKYR